MGQWRGVEGIQAVRYGEEPRFQVPAAGQGRIFDSS